MPDLVGNEVACLSTFVVHMRQTRAPSELHHVGSPLKERVGREGTTLKIVCRADVLEIGFWKQSGSVPWKCLGSSSSY